MITEKDLSKDLCRIKKKLGKIPTIPDYDEHGRFNSRTVKRRFGSWNKALESTFGQTNIDTMNPKIEVQCHVCQKPFMKFPAEIKKSKSGYHFCSKRCSASYFNTLKRKSRRSKCEKMLFDLLKQKYPQLDIINNVQFPPPQGWGIVPSQMTETFG